AWGGAGGFSPPPQAFAPCGARGPGPILKGWFARRQTPVAETGSPNMAETITIICPECEKSIKAPAEVVGKKIRCKGCGETFTARAPKESPKGIKTAKDAKAKDKDKPAKKKPEGGDEDEGGAYGIKEEYL